MATGGVANVIANLAQGLVDRGHQAIIVAITGPVEGLPNTEIAKYSLGTSLRTPRGIRDAVTRLQSIIREVGPTIVHSHAFHANMLCRLAGVLYLRKFSLVSTTHSTAEGPERNRHISIRTAWASDINTAVSGAVSAAQAGDCFNRRPTEIVYNGIAVDEFTPDVSAGPIVRKEFGIPSGARIIITVARLTPSKDYETLLRAFALVVKKLTDVHLLAVGEGPEREAILGLVNELNLQGRTHFVGERSDVRALLSAADLFVLASKWEGLGLVVCEAMCVGLPCVVSNIGGIPEAAGGHASLAIPGSAPDFADRIIESLERPRLDYQVEDARRFTIQRFSRESMVAGYIGVYSKALEIRRTRGPFRRRRL
ncbi:glycosyltransferase [Dietzia sp. Die43]|uniref:glycosyltransferase n=1 Tax=Dietzia sp. Die43 TaxID=2926011 RepID=UPI0035ABE40A